MRSAVLSRAALVVSERLPPHDLVLVHSVASSCEAAQAQWRAMEAFYKAGNRKVHLAFKDKTSLRAVKKPA